MGKTFAHVATAFCEKEQQHTKGTSWEYYDNGWNSYYFNNGKGAYTGEYSRNIYGGGGANGWGCFANQEEYHYASLGKHITESNECPLNGEGIVINYHDDNSIVMSYGTWDKGNLKNRSTWSNSSVDSNLTASLNIILPF